VAQVIAAHGLDLFSQDEYPVGAVYAVGHAEGLADRGGGGPKGGGRLRAVVDPTPLTRRKGRAAL
jgi:hypothetical protein